MNLESTFCHKALPSSLPLGLSLDVVCCIIIIITIVVIINNNNKTKIITTASPAQGQKYSQ